LPYVSDVPVIGLPFRRTEDEVNEIELLILVTPEFVDAVDACELQHGGPGTFTTSPTNHGLYCGGQMEVPTHCNPIQGLGSCGGDDCCSSSGGSPHMGGAPMGGSVILPGGTGYDDSTSTTTDAATTVTDQPQPSPAPNSEPANSAPAGTTPAPATLPPQSGAYNLPEDIALPVFEENPGIAPRSSAAAPPASVAPSVQQDQPAANDPQLPLPGSTTHVPGVPSMVPATPAIGPGAEPVYTAPRPYSPQRQPVFMRNASRPYNPQQPGVQPAAPQRENSLIGPVGYDVQ
jgi:hypothetical protein